MSDAVECVLSEDEDFVVKRPYTSGYSRNNKDQCESLVLKARENIFKTKSKCNRTLKKKLKKYKLRKDGQEDPEVLDVSQCFYTSLKIKSPVGVNNNNECEDENINKWEIKNYLTKTSKKSSCIMKASGSVCKKKYGKMEVPQTDSEDNKIPTDKSKRQMEEIKVSNSSEDEIVLKNEAVNPQNKPKEMNAFQLMMNARNKSIGSNSPGKEKSLELTEDEKAKKHQKVKRTLALEKLAQAKGSLKNIEAEALKDDRIKIKMNKRAKRLKNMLTKPTTSENHQSEDSAKNCRKSNSSSNQTIKRRRKSDDNSEKIIKRLKTDSCDNDIIHIHDDVIDVQQNYKQKTEEKKSMVNEKKVINRSLNICKKICKSDAEFLNKLSPSMKKKESMLSYFGKIEKIDEIEVEDDPLPENVIKVKFTPRRKKKEKKQKSKISKHETLENKNEEDQETHEESTEIEQNEIIFDDKLKKKGKLKLKVNENQITSQERINLVAESTEQSLKINDCNERRSKRATKNQVKYQDGFDSPPEQDSDDELVIITPEKPNLNKKTSGSTLKLKKPIAPKLMLKDSSVGKNEKEKDIIQPTKLAPIFAQKNLFNKAEMEAKQKFLQSGIPDKLKKIIDRQKSFESLENDNFTTVHHVQQKILSLDDFNPWTLKPINFNLLSEDNHFDVTYHNDNFLSNFKFETSLKKFDKSRKSVSCKETLQFIKSNYPKFPVYRTFRLLKNKCTPDKMQCSQVLDLDTLERSSDVIQDLLETKDDQNLTMWSDKFRPTCTSDIIGNFEGVKALKKWLSVWKETHLEGKNQHMRQRSDSSDSSDFYYPSDTDSRDSTKSYNNVLVVTGPVGCGKTSAIYAVATELAMKVIEVNASAKRTGKTILSNLQEATQSHKVNRGTTSAENSQNSQENSDPKFKIIKNKYLKTYSKSAKSLQSLEKINEILSESQTSKNENNRTGMSLILIEDADLVFEQDDGFVSALNQIVQISKRPVILVTVSLTCPHLQRFITNGNVINFHRLSPKMLGTWLDLMCLVENGDIWPNMGQNLLEFFGGDIRKAINALQFWVSSHTSNNNTDLDLKELVPNTDSQERLGVDECSTTSWSDQDQRPLKDIQSSDGSKRDYVLNKELFKTFISANDHDIGINKSILQLPVDHLNIWWNIPHLFVSENANNVDTTENVEAKNNAEKACLKSLTKLIDSVSSSDFMLAKMRPSLNASVASSPWKSKLCDSVSDAVNMLSFNSSESLGDSLSYALLTTSINITQRTFGIKDDQLCVDYALPGMSQIRARERIISRHNGLYDGLSLHCRLDRRGLAMDYLSTCREICRIEKNKSANNCKRNNRFYHYLRSMKVACSSETLDILCESLGRGDKK